MIRRLHSLPDNAIWGEWLQALSGLARAALRRPESVLSMLSELQSMEEVGPVVLDEVIEVLSARLRFLRREPDPRRYGSVYIASIDEARGRNFDVVFLPGLAEGLFPRKMMEDPPLLDITGSRRSCCRTIAWCANACCIVRWQWLTSAIFSIRA